MGDVITTVLMLAPILAVLWLANISYRRRIEGDTRQERIFKLLSYGLLFLLYAAATLIGLLILGFSAIAIAMPEAIDAPGLAAAGFLDLERLPWMGIALCALSVLGMLLLTRPARRQRPNRPDHHGTPGSGGVRAWQ